MNVVSINWKELPPSDKLVLARDFAQDIMTPEELKEYLRFSVTVGLYEMFGKTYGVRVVPSWEIIYFTGEPVFELWLFKGKDIDEYMRHLGVFDVLTDMRLRFIVAQEGKDIYNPLESFRVFAQVLRRIKDTGYFIFANEAHALAEAHDPKWYELVRKVVNELRKKSYGAIHPRQALADFGYKKMKIGKIFYSAYNPVELPGEGEKVDVKAAREFLWTYVWNQMVPIIGQEKAEEIYEERISYVHKIVDYFYVNFIQKTRSSGEQNETTE